MLPFSSAGLKYFLMPLFIWKCTTLSGMLVFYTLSYPMCHIAGELDELFFHDLKNLSLAGIGNTR